ncbi:MAG: hypothetical protein JXB49_14165 [Bacteroidales bacterium]|nr:hypothetical protein [Bacteroidales bacterium]
MDCACIGIFRKTRLDESYRDILKIYEYLLKKEAITWFSIALEWHMESTYTDYEREKLTRVFGSFPEQEILLFGDCNLIFVAAHELIKYFGGLLNVSIGSNRKYINSFPGIKIPVRKEKYSHDPDYHLVDHIFIRKFFAEGREDNFEKYKLEPLLPSTYFI